MNKYYYKYDEEEACIEKCNLHETAYIGSLVCQRCESCKNYSNYEKWVECLKHNELKGEIK